MVLVLVVVDGAVGGPGQVHQLIRAPARSGHPETLYRRMAEISPPGRSSRCGGVLIGRP